MAGMNWNSPLLPWQNTAHPWKKIPTSAGTGGLPSNNVQLPWKVSPVPIADGQTPTVYANFADNHYWYNGAFTDVTAWLTALGGTFTRASTAYRTNSSGLLESVASNALRFDYTSAGVPKGILLEGSRTNLALHSQDLTNAVYWAGLNATVAAGSVSGPDGTNNLQLVTSSNGNGGRIAHVFNLTTGTAYTFSCYCSPGSSNYAGTVLGDGLNTDIAGAIYTLTGDGTVVSTAGNASPTATITKVGASLYRCTLTITTSNTALNSFGVGVSDGSTYASTVYPSAAAGTVNAGFAQVEAASFASSYIPTTTASVTRAADLLDTTVATGATGSAYAKITDIGIDASQNQKVIGGDSGGAWRLACDAVSASAYRAQIYNGTNGAATANNFTATGTAKMMSAWDGTSWSLCLNAGAIATDASAQGAIGNLQFGGHDGGTSLFGRIMEVAYWPIRATNAELQRLTT